MYQDLLERRRRFGFSGLDDEFVAPLMQESGISSGEVIGSGAAAGRCAGGVGLVTGDRGRRIAAVGGSLAGPGISPTGWPGLPTAPPSPVSPKEVPAAVEAAVMEAPPDALWWGCGRSSPGGPNNCWRRATIVGQHTSKRLHKPKSTRYNQTTLARKAPNHECRGLLNA